MAEEEAGRLSGTSGTDVTSESKGDALGFSWGRTTGNVRVLSQSSSFSTY